METIAVESLRGRLILTQNEGGRIVYSIMYVKQTD